MRKQTTKHKQVKIWNPLRKERISVDEGIFPLLRVMWDIGIDTVLSCQEDILGAIWKQFGEPDDALNFADIVMSDDNLRGIITCEHCCRWTVSLFNLNDDDSSGASDEPCPHFFVSVLFPNIHYDRILALFLETRTTSK